MSRAQIRSDPKLPKKLKKSQQTRRDLGDAGAEKVKDLDAEIAVLKPFLPQMIEGAELEALLDGIIAKTGATGPGDLGAGYGLTYEGSQRQRRWRPGTQILKLS